MTRKDREFERLFLWAFDALEARRGFRSRSPLTVLKLLTVEGLRDILKDPEIPPDLRRILTNFRHLSAPERERKARSLLSSRLFPRTPTMWNRPPARWNPEHPIREVLQALCGARPPAFIQGWDTKNLTDQQMTELQDWCAQHARPQWATGLSMWEAAELIIEGAIENGNIRAPESAKRSLTVDDVASVEAWNEEDWTELHGSPNEGEPQ